jgi:hypothetical protein
LPTIGLLQVRARAEGRAFVRHHHGADPGIGVGLLDRIMEPVQDARAERVAVLDVGEGDGQDPVRPLDPDLAHVPSPRPAEGGAARRIGNFC